MNKNIAKLLLFGGLCKRWINFCRCVLWFLLICNGLSEDGTGGVRRNDAELTTGEKDDLGDLPRFVYRERRSDICGGSYHAVGIELDLLAGQDIVGNNVQIVGIGEGCRNGVSVRLTRQ